MTASRIFSFSSWGWNCCHPVIAHIFYGRLKQPHQSGTSPAGFRCPMSKGARFMTYQDDPNGNLRRNDPEGANSNYTGWIIGAAVALAVVLGVSLMSNGTNNSGMATNDSPTISRPATEPTTTGSGSSQPSNPPASVPTTPNAR
jgi:hypothetical protein